jgi:hypothetical protein
MTAVARTPVPPEAGRRIVGGMLEDLAAALILEALDARDRDRR